MAELKEAAVAKPKTAKKPKATRKGSKGKAKGKPC